MLFRVMLVLAAFAVVPECWAADTAGGNAFLDAKIGSMFGRQPDSGYSDSGTRISWGADGGYRWKLRDAVSGGFEAGYMHLGEVDRYSGNSGQRSTTANAISLGGNFQFLLGEDRATIFQVRGGYLSARLHDAFYSYFVGGPGTDSYSESGIYFGLGIGRKLTQGFSVLLAFNQFNVNGNDRNGGWTWTCTGSALKPNISSEQVI